MLAGSEVDEHFLSQRVSLCDAHFVDCIDRNRKEF